MENGVDKTYGQVDSNLLLGLTEQQKSAVLNWNAYQQFQQAMFEVAANMKEIPILPSEIPPEHDRHALTKVELPSEGGVLTFMEHYEYPYRGFPYMEFVDKSDTIKKLIRGSLSGLYHSFKKNKWKLFLALPAVLIFRELLWAGVYTFYLTIERLKIKSFRYSKAIRELYRAFSIPRNDPKTMEFRFMLRDVLCMILEFDNAYRFRFQDIICELNKEQLKKNPIKELNRLLKDASGREKDQKISDTWKLVRMFNSFYLRFDRQLKKLIVDVLLNLNLEELKFTPEDTTFWGVRKDYVFRNIDKQDVINKPL